MELLLGSDPFVAYKLGKKFVTVIRGPRSEAVRHLPQGNAVSRPLCKDREEREDPSVDSKDIW